VLSPDGYVEHSEVDAWARNRAIENKYIGHGFFSFENGQMTDADYVAVMQAFEEKGITDWRLIGHDDTKHSHAHFLFFHDKRRWPKQEFNDLVLEIKTNMHYIEKERLRYTHIPTRLEYSDDGWDLLDESDFEIDDDRGLGW